MYDSPVGYPNGKRGFLWLIWVGIDGKKMIVILLEVIIEDFDYPFGLASKVWVFIWSFIFGGRLSIVLSISSGVEEDGSEDKDGFVSGYTHKGGGMNLVLIAGGILER